MTGTGSTSIPFDTAAFLRPEDLAGIPEDTGRSIRESKRRTREHLIRASAIDEVGEGISWPERNANHMATGKQQQSKGFGETATSS